GFWLLRVHDSLVATRVAAAINAAVAVVALPLLFVRRYRPAAPPAGPDAMPAADPGAAPSARAVHAGVAPSGFPALGAEVVWPRLLSLLFGASVYTFSLILAVFLLGLGLGSRIGSRLAARSESPWRLLAWCQFLLVPAFVYSAWLIASVIP